MKKFLFVLVALLVTSFAFSQNNLQDVVYLKNGSIIRGIIIEQVPNKLVKIQTADQNVFVFEIDEIEKLTKEEALNQSKVRTNKTSSGIENPSSGFTSHIELGPLVYVGNLSNLNVFSFRTLLGGRVSKAVSLGAEIGVDAATSYVSAPVGFGLRTNFLDSRYIPFFDFSTGYAYHTGGRFGFHSVYFTPSVGFKFRVKSNVAPYIKFGYYGDYWIDAGMVNGVNIKFGVELNK